jgi:hypothetical protein
MNIGLAELGVGHCSQFALSVFLDSGLAPTGRPGMTP